MCKESKMSKLSTIVSLVALSLVSAAPAFAQVIDVPEPATISLFAVGAAGAVVARKLMRRK